MALVSSSMFKFWNQRIHPETIDFIVVVKMANLNERFAESVSYNFIIWKP